MSPRRKVAAQSQEVHLNHDLPTLYVDNCAVSHRGDGMNYLSFATNTPNTPVRVVEQARLIVDDDSLKEILDVMCRSVDYFPEKPTKKRRRSTK